MNNLFRRDANLGSPADQSADFVELFFDLVFVYAITRITAVTAHHLDWPHVLRSILVLWLIWWGWTQFTWALNAAHTGLAIVRTVVLIATGVAFVMASFAGDAFEHKALWFAVPYVIIRIIGLSLYIRVTSNLQGHRDAVIAFAVPSALGLLAVLTGALSDPEARVWWWLGAIALDFLAGYLGGRAEGWRLHAGHFVERHGLILIIALGESLIVAAAAVGSMEHVHDFFIVGGLAVGLTCLLWWSYFSWIREQMEEALDHAKGSRQATLARDAFSFLHFPLICGIIGIAVAYEIILMHPHDLLTAPVAYCMGGGYILFVGSTAAAYWRAGGMILVPRLMIMTAAAIGVYLCIGQPPYIAMAILVFSLLVLFGIEWKKCSLQ
jgi:low temperature requirement protein LtrA